MAKAFTQSLQPRHPGTHNHHIIRLIVVTHSWHSKERVSQRAIRFSARARRFSSARLDTRAIAADTEPR